MLFFSVFELKFVLCYRGMKTIFSCRGDGISQSLFAVLRCLYASDLLILTFVYFCRSDDC